MEDEMTGIVSDFIEELDIDERNSLMMDVRENMRHTLASYLEDEIYNKNDAELGLSSSKLTVGIDDRIYILDQDVDNLIYKEWNLMKVWELDTIDALWERTFNKYTYQIKLVRGYDLPEKNKLWILPYDTLPNFPLEMREEMMRDVEKKCWFCSEPLKPGNFTYLIANDRYGYVNNDCFYF